MTVKNPFNKLGPVSLEKLTNVIRDQLREGTIRYSECQRGQYTHILSGHDIRDYVMTVISGHMDEVKRDETSTQGAFSYMDKETRINVSYIPGDGDRRPDYIIQKHLPNIVRLTPNILPRNNTQESKIKPLYPPESRKKNRNYSKGVMKKY